MLKINHIQLLDKNNQLLLIEGKHIESFPLQGGEEANMVSVKSWNQQGNTFINAFMESFEGELDFIIPTHNKSDEEILERREKIISFCNPLNGIVTMKVILNSGDTFLRDVTFISAPIFPIGFENRNENWQKVRLIYEANNPFWYSENAIYETFKTNEPNFLLPFQMSETSPIIFGNMIPANIAINEGHVEAPIIISIKGNCINPIIENITTGEFIKFNNLTMGADDELIINTAFGEKKIELNGENIFNKLDFSSTFFSLAKGENVIDFRDESANNLASILFIYKNLYISI